MGIKGLGGCLSIPSGPSGHEERQVTLPLLTHLLIQEVNV